MVFTHEKKPRDHYGCLRVAVVFFSILAVAFFLPFLAFFHSPTPTTVPCGDICSLQLAESIPENLTFPEGSPKHISTYEAWKDLIGSAEKTIDIAAFYWSLRNEDLQPPVESSHKGQDIFDSLIEVSKKKGIAIRIVVDTEEDKFDDTKILEAEGVAEVRRINFKKLLGDGVLHTKMWLVDGKHFAVGSANLDWRSLTQVKELSAIVKDCPCYGEDLAKIFQVYWDLGQPDAEIPSHWPSSLSTNFNKDSPLKLMMNNTETETYLSSSPPMFCPDGRTGDLDAILDVMDKAKKFIDVSVMTYLPFEEFSEPRSFWNAIDAKLRAMAFNKRVKVRLMTGYWEHTDSATAGFLQSLAALNNTHVMNVEVKRFVVPLNHFPVPYSRVNHCKFMVTDNAAYVGTSNWARDYFTDTGGVGFIINNTATTHEASESSSSFQLQLRAVFERDWSSHYAYPVIVPELNMTGQL